MDFLGAAVNVAAQKLAHDHPAMARRLKWSLDLVNKDPAHALEMIRLDLARHAVVHHATGQLAHRPTPTPTSRNSPTTVFDRLKTAASQEFDRQVFAVTHPVEALANNIHERRLTHGGERHLARVNDLIGGGAAGTIAELGEGVGRAADLHRRYLQGGLVTDAIGKRFFGLPAPPSAADEAATLFAPLKREANQRPPRTFAGTLVSGAPGMAVAMIPGAGPALLGLKSLGAASSRARDTHAPDTPKNDAAMIATAAIDTAAGFLLKGGGRVTDPARYIEQQLAERRGDLLDLSAKVAAKSVSGSVTGASQTAADNFIAGNSYDPDRRWDEGLGESAILGGATAPFGRIGHNSRPELPASASVPFRSYNTYEILSEHPVTGRGRSWHRSQANRLLHSQMGSDGDFAAILNDAFGADVYRHMNSGSSALLVNPPGAVWHHPVDRPGVVQLLRKSEHTDPRLQHVLHSGPKKRRRHCSTSHSKRKREPSRERSPRRWGLGYPTTCP